MRSMLVSCVGLATCLSGCFGFSDRSGSHDGYGATGPTGALSLPSQCRPPGTSELQSLYDETEQSIHELITCGGLQMKVAQSMKLMIFASNEGLVSPSARDGVRNMAEMAGLTLDNPFTDAGDGTWSMGGIDSRGSSDSTFVLRFFDPATGDLIRVDPFRLDSYLVGVTATSSRTWEQMQADPTAKTTFTFQWTKEGPLARLLASGGTIPNPIRLELSLYELGGALFGLSEPDYGAFGSVQEILMDSKVHLVDRRGGIDITYDVSGAQDTVRSLVELSAIHLHVDSLVSTDGTIHLSGRSENLAFARGSLSGKLQYSLSGGIVVTSDFGDGSSYPDSRWACR